MAASAGGWRPVYRAVCRIPAGKVATYGQIAALAGMPRAARQVGWALSALGEEDDVPWHRVINAQGEISSRGGCEVVDLQRALLESEGVDFNTRGRIDLKRFAWEPSRRASRSRKTQEKPASRAKSKAPGHMKSRVKISVKSRTKKTQAKGRATKREATK